MKYNTKKYILAVLCNNCDGISLSNTSLSTLNEHQGQCGSLCKTAKNAFEKYVYSIGVKSDQEVGSITTLRSGTPPRITWLKFGRVFLVGGWERS